MNSFRYLSIAWSKQHFIAEQKREENAVNNTPPPEKHPKLQLYQDVINTVARNIQASSEHVIKFDDEGYDILFDLIKYFYTGLVRRLPRKGERVSKSNRRVYEDLFGDPSLVATSFHQALQGESTHIFTEDGGILPLLAMSYKILASDDL